MYDHTDRHVMEIDECTLKGDKEDCFGNRGCFNRLEPTNTLTRVPTVPGNHGKHGIYFFIFQVWKSHGN